MLYFIGFFTGNSHRNFWQHHGNFPKFLSQFFCSRPYIFPMYMCNKEKFFGCSETRKAPHILIHPSINQSIVDLVFSNPTIKSIFRIKFLAKIDFFFPTRCSVEFQPHIDILHGELSSRISGMPFVFWLLCRHSLEILGALFQYSVWREQTVH